MRSGAPCSFGVVRDFSLPDSHVFSQPGSKASRTYGNVSIYVSAVQMAVGTAGFFIASKYLFDYTSSTGQILCFTLIANGALGLAGSICMNRSILHAYCLGSAVALLLSFHFVSQLGRETQVNCALAELYLRNHVMEDFMKKQNTAELFSNVYQRVNELEDMMRAVQESAVKSIEARAEQHRLKLTDRNYVKSKLDMLKRHASDLFEKVANHPNITESEKYGLLDPDSRRNLVNKIDNAEEILESVSKYTEDASSLTYEAYVAILHSLIQSYVAEASLKEPHHQLAKAELRQAHVELPNMKAAIARQKSNTYHELSAGPAGEHLSAVERARRFRQHEWNTKLRESIGMLQPVLDKEPLEKMPQHCLLGVRYFSLLEYLVATLVLFQLASAYCISSLMIHLPIKID